jgi:hypothetical protein
MPSALVSARQHENFRLIPLWRTSQICSYQYRLCALEPLHTPLVVRESLAFRCLDTVRAVILVVVCQDA